MKYRFLEIQQNLKFRVFLTLGLVLFFFKLFASGTASALMTGFNELLVILTATVFIFYLKDFVHNRQINPLTLVMSIGILNALIFFLLEFSDLILGSFFGNIEQQIAHPGLIFNLVYTFYVFIILSSIAYVFLSLREFYFYREKRNKTTYFNTMIIFFILASLAALLKGMPEFAYIWNTFLIISIILIIINSIKISWIAFIVKKDKVTLLILSTVITVLFIVNLVNYTEDNINRKLLTSFSPSIAQFTAIIMIYGVIYFSILFFTTLFHLPTAEAFDRKAQEVSSLQYFSKLITEVLDFKELTETITDLAVKICGADASWIVWKSDNEYKILANNNIGYVDANAVTELVIGKSRKGIIDSTTILDLKKIKTANLLSVNYNAALFSSLRTHNDIKGYLCVARKGDISFDEEDISAINTFSDYASVAIENARLVEESIEKERLEKELDVAREVQRKILPAKNPEFENLDISSVFIPAFEVGGDYYDFFEISQDKLGFVIADVAGKGISAAFIMAEVKGIFESLSKFSSSPKELLVRANQILQRTLERKSFVSAAYGVIDIQKEVLSIARAGHCPVLCIRGNEVQNLTPSGMGLGLDFSEYFENTLEEKVIKLKTDDVIVLYTDGITEAKNSKLEDFGTKHFEQILLENRKLNADEISNKVIQAVTLFSQSNSQHDDITLVILKWKQKVKINGEEEWQNLAPQLKNMTM
jgi:serine phosphatase RsbU (regulator of sigma subunit)